MKIRLLIVALVLAAGCAKSEPVTTKAAPPPAEDQLHTLYQRVEQRQPEPPASKPGPVRPDYEIKYSASSMPSRKQRLDPDEDAMPLCPHPGVLNNTRRTN